MRKCVVVNCLTRPLVLLVVADSVRCLGGARNDTSVKMLLSELGPPTTLLEANVEREIIIGIILFKVSIRGEE